MINRQTSLLGYWNDVQLITFFSLIYLFICLFIFFCEWLLILGNSLWQTDWDLRLACLLLYAFDREDNFWQLYGDFLPSAEECTSLLFATEVHDCRLIIFLALTVLWFYFWLFCPLIYWFSCILSDSVWMQYSWFWVMKRINDWVSTISKHMPWCLANGIVLIVNLEIIII